MNRENPNPNQYLGTVPLRAYLIRGFNNGAAESLVYPLKAIYAFYHTKDVNPFLLKYGIRMGSPLDYYTYFMKRDGSYRIWNCFWSGAMDTVIETLSSEIKLYFLNQIFKFEDSTRPDPSTGRLPKISAKKAVRYMFVLFGVDIVTALIDNPIGLPWAKMLADYEPVPQYDHIIDCWCKTVEKDGFLGLFKSLGWSILGRLMESATNAFLYYHNQPSDLVDFRSDTYERMNWIFYAANTFSVIATHGIHRLVMQNIIVEKKSEINIGRFFDGIWVGFVPLAVAGLPQLYRVIKKELS